MYWNAQVFANSDIQEGSSLNCDVWRKYRLKKKSNEALNLESREVMMGIKALFDVGRQTGEPLNVEACSFERETT